MSKHLIFILSWLLRNLGKTLGKKLLKSRLDFESEFSVLTGDFDSLVHVSSEGELEMAMPLIESFDSVIVVGTSQSLTHRFRLLTKKGFNVCALPITTGFGQWDKLAPRDVFIVRYDFFPHVLEKKWSSSSRVVLLQADPQRSPTLSRFIFPITDLVVCSLPGGVVDAVEMGARRSLVAELRIDSIQSRLNGRHRTLDQRLPNWKRWQQDFGDHVLLGSAWEEDLEHFPSTHWKKLIIAPHDLSERNVSRICEKLRDLGHQPQVVDESSRELSDCNVLTVRGVLTELYAEVPRAYVGGGHGKGLHSVLEPYVAGASISCANPQKRSVELDYLNQAGIAVTQLARGEVLEELAVRHYPSPQSDNLEAIRSALIN